MAQENCIQLVLQPLHSLLVLLCLPRLGLQPLDELHSAGCTFLELDLSAKCWRVSGMARTF